AGGGRSVSLYSRPHQRSDIRVAKGGACQESCDPQSGETSSDAGGLLMLLRRPLVTAMVGSLLCSGALAAQTSVYAPLGSLDGSLMAGTSAPYASRAVKSADRPSPPGAWPRDVELLTDALLRKHARLLKRNPVCARDASACGRELIIRRYATNSAQLRG